MSLQPSGADPDPLGTPVLDKSGNIYGVAAFDGSSNEWVDETPCTNGERFVQRNVRRV